MLAASAYAQQQPIAYVPTQGVSLSGSLAVANGKASIGSNGTIAAGDSTAHVTLARGGELLLCASTKVHLSKDTSVNSADPTADSALMIALDRGAIEASYTPGKYSDVVLTPDLRILVSGPGQADLKIHTNQKGDTCIDNHGANAPYVTVTSQFEGGLYRVQPNQRVMFEHGSLNQVVDNETEPCGCPAPEPAVSVASVAPGIVSNPGNSTKPAPPIGGPSSTPADTAFPLAQSEGLKAASPPPTQPVVPAGTPHIEVEVPITYDAKATPNPEAPGAAGPPPAGCKGTGGVDCPNLFIASSADIPTETQQIHTQISTMPITVVAIAQPAKQQQGGFFHSLGHFFSHLFGR
jgi:hypothetical protein